MQASRYSITEPHPTTNTYTYSGRGGAGNTFRAPKTSDGRVAQGPASLFETGLPVSSSKFTSGRGGAGNIHHSKDRAVFSFDDELARQSSRDQKARGEGFVYHVGRGGAGNRSSASSATPVSGRKDSMSSVDSDGSARSGFFQRLSNSLERR